MPGLLYYIPKLNGPPPDLLAAGVGHAFEARPVCRQVSSGPDGQGGVVLADGRLVAEVGYFADRQRWLKAVSDPGRELWVGVYTDCPLPGPADLTRKTPITGHWLELLDGRQWLVPVARCYADEDGELRWSHNLPFRLSRAADGTWQSAAVVPRYQSLWDLAERWENNHRDAARSAGKDAKQVSFRFDDVVNGAVAALAANYFLGPTEVDLLGLLSVDLAVEVLGALIDIPTRLAWCKKKAAAAASAGSNTAAGPAASTPATNPP